jgi:hypothetical protein
VTTNGITDEIFSSVYCSELYWHNFLLLYLLVNTNENIMLVYTEGIAVGKERIKNLEKYNDMWLLPME